MNNYNKLVKEKIAITSIFVTIITFFSLFFYIFYFDCVVKVFFSIKDFILQY